MIEYRWLRIGVLFVFFLSAASTVRAAAVSGQVLDYSGDVFFANAHVELVPLAVEADATQARITTLSDSQGRFQFNQLAAGTYELTAHYVGAGAVVQHLELSAQSNLALQLVLGAAVPVLENIIVVGQQAGHMRSQNQVRAADGLLSVVTADAIGQFPDENVTEALQRVSGVFIERDQGEGRFFGVRGVDPALNSASVNGLSLPSPDSDKRNVALDVVPADLVASLEVTKTATPDQDGDAIGGHINIKNVSGLDFSGMTYQVSGRYYFNEPESDSGNKLSGRYTNHLLLGDGELGVAVNLSTSQRRFSVDTLVADGRWERESGAAFHEELEWHDYQIQRDRDGFALNLDYLTAQQDRYYLRSLYSQFGDHELRNRVEFKLDKGDVDVADAMLLATDTELQRELKDRFEEQTIYSFLLGGENQLGPWTFEYSSGVSLAREIEPDRIDSEFKNKSVDTAGYNGLGSTPEIFYAANGADADDFKLTEIEIENNKAQDRQYVVSADITYQLGSLSGKNELQFGFKHQAREKKNDVNVRIFEDFNDAFAVTPLLTDFTQGSRAYGFGDYGPSISPALTRSFVSEFTAGNAACLLHTYLLDMCPFILDEDNSTLASARDYRMDEDVSALYALQRVEFGALRVVYGLRYEYTRFLASGFNVRELDVPDSPDVNISSVAYHNDYDHFLPSINLRYQPKNDWIVRAAYSKTLARPSFSDLSPTPKSIDIEADGSDVALAVEAGNPSLSPYQSDNIDIAADFVSARFGDFQIAAFYKNIENFIFSADVSSVVDPVTYAGSIAVTDVEIYQPRNGGAAEIVGLDLGWQQYFQSLPAPLDGLLIAANATFSHSSADLGEAAAGNRSRYSALPEQASRVANFTLGYEKNGVDLRLSSSYIAKRLVEIDLASAEDDLYEDSRQQVDFSARLNLGRNLQWFFNVINITEEPTYRYYGERRYLARYEDIGRSYAVGFTYRNF